MFWKKADLCFPSSIIDRISNEPLSCQRPMAKAVWHRLGQTKPLFRGGQRAPRHVDLFGLRLEARERFHKLSSDLVVEITATAPRRLQELCAGQHRSALPLSGRPELAAPVQPQPSSANEYVQPTCA